MKVLVIGAGASGLPALKTALEHGFSARCFEKSKDIGGLWRFKDDPEEGEGTVMKSTVINTSKEMTAYSDFPPLEGTPNYMHNSIMFDYIKQYAAKFKLLDKVFFEHKVLSVERAKGFSDNGQWNVKYEVILTGDLLTETFDGVMCCTGHHSIPHWPSKFPGQDSFKGQVMHAKSYNSMVNFADKTVIVVGIGNSGSDIAVELSKIAKQVYLSTRSGSWIMNRVWDFGEPSDLAILNRFTFGLKKMAPRWLQNTVMENKVNRRFDHARFGVKPDHRFLEAHVTVNDELPNRIVSGTVVIKSNLAEFGENSVVFEDSTFVDKVDVVIFATGYKFSFDYIENGNVIKVENNKVLLYKFMFPPSLAPKNSLAIIGLIQPTGSIMPISEMQARVFCGQLSGLAQLPNKLKMIESAIKTNAKNSKHFLERPRHTLQVYYVEYMDSLAKLIKVKPNVIKTLLTDPVLAKKLIFSGLVPYQYRLTGPYSWPEARENILEFDERVFNCTRTRITKNTADSKAEGRIYVLRLLL